MRGRRRKRGGGGGGKGRIYREHKLKIYCRGGITQLYSISEHNCSLEDDVQVQCTYIH